MRNSKSPLPIQAASCEPFARAPENLFSGPPLTETYTSPSDPSPVSQLIVVVANLVEPAGAGLGFAVMVGAASEFGAGSGTVASEERLQPPARARARRRLPIGTPRTENVKR